MLTDADRAALAECRAANREPARRRDPEALRRWKQQWRAIPENRDKERERDRERHARRKAR